MKVRFLPPEQIINHQNKIIMLLGFKERFVEPIQNKTKIFTMRKRRKIEPKIGETLYMYHGLRRLKPAFKISDNEKLKAIQTAEVFVWCGFHKGELGMKIRIKVDGRSLIPEEVDQFVIYDGFQNRVQFGNYWLTDGTRLKTKVKETMDLYHWTDFKY